MSPYLCHHLRLAIPSAVATPSPSSSSRTDAASALSDVTGGPRAATPSPASAWLRAPPGTRARMAATAARSLHRRALIVMRTS